MLVGVGGFSLLPEGCSLVAASLSCTSKSPPSSRSRQRVLAVFPWDFLLYGFTPARAKVPWVSPVLRLPGGNLGLECGILGRTMNFLQSELGNPELGLRLWKGCLEPIPFTLLRVGSGAPHDVIFLVTIPGPSVAGKTRLPFCHFPEASKHSLTHSSS